jgi:small basic protein
MRGLVTWRRRSDEGSARMKAVLKGGSAVYGVLALVVGIVLGVVFSPQVPDAVQPYLPIAVVAALDAVFGGLRAYLDEIFDSKVFVVSFVFNVLVAALIVWLGDQLGVGTQLSTAIVVVLGIRIFGNAAALRRRLFGA